MCNWFPRALNSTGPIWFHTDPGPVTTIWLLVLETRPPMDAVLRPISEPPLLTTSRLNTLPLTSIVPSDAQREPGPEMVATLELPPLPMLKLLRFVNNAPFVTNNWLNEVFNP